MKKLNSYDIFMAPIEKLWLKKIRKQLISKTKGNVLEIGFGTGVNYNYYNFDNVKTITATDVLSQAKALEHVDFIETTAEDLPFDSGSFDYVVGTLVLCSVSDVQKALFEIERVLVPGGKYIFIEHVRPKGFLGYIFDFINKVWKNNRYGCQINKRTIDIINKQGGFSIESKSNPNIWDYGIAIKK